MIFGRMAPRLLGRRGEFRAAWFYLVRGYRIVERNARTTHGEIDLVLKRGNTLVIAEVKTRQTHTAGEGYEAVDRRKRERLVRMGDRYAARFPDVQLRYDIVSLFWNGWRFQITHFANAFEPVADPHRPWIWRA
jgi:putative endonuclease